MKKLAYIFYAFLFIGLVGCEEELGELGQLSAPSNLSVTANVSTDGSGQVIFNATADGVQTYHFYFGLSESEGATLVPSGELTYFYRSSGTYTARVVAFGSGGLSSSETVEIDIEVDFSPPADLVKTLTNGDSRTWVWKKEVAGHLGVGPEFYDDGSVGDQPIWYQASAFEKESEGCLYTDEIVFAQNGDGSVSMALNNGGVTYFHVDEAADALGVPRPAADQCFDYDIGTGTSTVSFFPTDTGLGTGVGMELSDNGFMSYFLGSSSYEIINMAPDQFTVRVVQEIPGLRLAWYQTFIATDAQVGGGGDDGEFQLVWEDEFDVNGAPNPDFWSYDIGRGDNGWGNGEEQYYTDRPDNVVVEDGVLKIIAKRESFSGAEYTSARLLTMDKFEFTYGKVEIRAKLPEGSGTWPALWMLGANFDQVGWPNCGEIDIMEHVGNDVGRVSAAIHSPSSFGNTVNVGATQVPTATTDFHVYSVEWSAEKIDFFVDGQQFYSYNPAVKDDSTYPFNADCFLILNVAMGGTLGGNISDDFNMGTMEVDYVKVYQKP